MESTDSDAKHWLRPIAELWRPHQLPWQLRFDRISGIPGNKTVCSQNNTSTPQRGVSLKSLGHCLCPCWTTEAIYPWQQEVVVELNADLCQSSCILISHKAACRRETATSVYACKNNRGTTLFDFVISCVPFSLGMKKKPHRNLIWTWCFRLKPSRCIPSSKTLLGYIKMFKIRATWRRSIYFSGQLMKSFWMSACISL